MVYFVSFFFFRWYFFYLFWSRKGLRTGLDTAHPPILAAGCGSLSPGGVQIGQSCYTLPNTSLGVVPCFPIVAGKLE
jgi:hypothetical protein